MPLTAGQVHSLKDSSPGGLRMTERDEDKIR